MTLPLSQTPGIPTRAVRLSKIPGRSIATTSTSKHANAPHNALTPSSSCANVAANSSSPADPRSAHRASPTPSRSPRNYPSLTSPTSDHSTAPRPGATVVGADRQGPHIGATSCRRSRHLTTVGRGWSFIGPPSRASDRGPLPPAVEANRGCPISNRPVEPMADERYDDEGGASALLGARSECHGCDSRAERVAVSGGDRRTVCSPQPPADDRRPRIRGVAPPRRTNLAPPVTPISFCGFSRSCGTRARRRCPTLATVGRGLRVVRPGGVGGSARVAAGGFLWLLADEPDVDPARVPEATGSPIRGHRGRNRD
jgi:hypothetical protein